MAEQPRSDKMLRPLIVVILGGVGAVSCVSLCHYLTNSKGSETGINPIGSLS